MRVPIPELLLTAVLAAAFAALGEILLRRRGRSLAEANEAMLAGMGAAAAALFPLTLLLGRHALRTVAGLLGAALAAALIYRVRAAVPPPPPRASDPSDRVARALLACVALVAAAFAALNFRLTYLWDGLLIWATKAQLLSHAGGLTREWYPGDVYDTSHLAYPPLVPLFESLVGLLRGGFEFDVLKPIFFVFFLSLLVGTWFAVRAVASARAAGLATLLVALVPALSSGPAGGAYADMPQAAFVAGVTAAALGRRREALPWVIGGLTVVKSEGTILAGLACGGLVLHAWLERRRGASRPTLAHGRAVAIVAAFFLIRFSYVRWISPAHEVYAATLSTALSRIPRVARLCLGELLDPRLWGLFWPAFLAASLFLLLAGGSRDRALAVTVAAGLVLMAIPFLFTTWPVELQISQAYSRLAAQLAPAAAVALVLGYRAARDRLDRDRLDEVRVLR